MGYEILDVGAGRGDEPTPVHGQPEVIDLESIPLPQNEPPPRPPAGRRPSRWTAITATAAMLVVGVGAGVWVEHHAKASDQAAAAAQVHVLAVAQPATMTLAGEVTAASVRVSLINLGQVP